MAEHAILSASGASRWLACTPSAQLEQQFQDQQSDYAAEGSFAHALADLKLSRAVANTTKPSVFKRKLAALRNETLYSTGLEEYVDQYVAQVSERYLACVGKCPDTLALLEQRLDFSDWVPGGFGTGDVVIISDDVIEVIDLKYGKGVPVSAEGNPQIRLYGLGAIKTYEMLYNFTRVRMTIIQPRLDSISTEEMTVNELLTWAEEHIKPRAALAIAGEGEFAAGEHCRFCKARATCRARADHNLELAKYDFQESFLLSHDEIANVLARAEELAKWANDVQEYALDQATNHGVKFPGWKLVEGRSNRKYADEAKVGTALTEAGYTDSVIYTRSLLGITGMEKMLGKKRFAELLNGLIVKPAGKPTLVLESDKRTEISSADDAKADFSEAVSS
ncbi:MAG: DUF2800 domain-containing protein [Bacillota bacterium]